MARRAPASSRHYVCSHRGWRAAVATVRRRLSRLDRFGIARSLRETARLLDLAGEPHFKVRAYERAAKVLERTTTDVGVLVDQGRLTELPGIGPRLASLVTELHLTGTSETL